MPNGINILKNLHPKKSEQVKCFFRIFLFTTNFYTLNKTIMNAIQLRVALEATEESTFSSTTECRTESFHVDKY